MRLWRLGALREFRARRAKAELLWNRRGRSRASSHRCYKPQRVQGSHVQKVYDSLTAQQQMAALRKTHDLQATLLRRIRGGE